MAVMRSMSAMARVHTLWPGKSPLRFIGSAERRLAKPECISPQIARQCARAARSSGRSPLPGTVSARYSPIARVSHTFTPSCVRHGTRMLGASNRISWRASGSSGATITSSKARPAKRAMSHPRKDHDE